MPANYEAIRNRSAKLVDRFLGETVEVVFHKGGKVDPGRPSVEITAMLRTANMDATGPEGRAGEGFASRVPGQPATLYVDRNTYPEFTAQAGDMVRAISRPGQPWLRTVLVDLRDHARLKLHLEAC